MQGFEEMAVFLHEANNVFFAYHLAVHTDALAEINQMGRGIETNLVTCRLEDGGQRVRTGALAVCPAYVYGTKLAVRMSEVLVEHVRIGQALLVGIASHMLEEWGAII